MIHIHPNWNKQSTNGHDLALVIIDDQQTLSGLAKSQLPKLPVQFEPDKQCCTEGDTLWSLGYGSVTEGGTSTGRLTKVKAHFNQKSEFCTDYPKRVMCAKGQHGADVCTGDSVK